MKSTLRYLVFFSIAASVLNTSWTANIAVLIDSDPLIFPGDDPINDPEARAFTLETIELQEPGIHWLVLHLENDLGHTVNIYGTDTDQDVPGGVGSVNDLIFVTESLGSGSVGGTYRGTDTPFMSTECWIMDEMGFSNNRSDVWDGGAMTSEIKIVNPDHPITRGLPETFTATITDETTGEPFLATFGTVNDLSALVGVGETLAVLPSSFSTGDAAPLPENAPVVIAVETGTTLDAGDTNNARWVFIGYSDVNPDDNLGGVDGARTLALLTEPAIQLLDQAIEWALGEEPAKVHDWSVR